MMNKKRCIKLLNEILEAIPNNEFFETLCDELNIDEDELELVLFSKITDIENDDIE